MAYIERQSKNSHFSIYIYNEENEGLDRNDCHKKESYHNDHDKRK